MMTNHHFHVRLIPYNCMNKGVLYFYELTNVFLCMFELLIKMQYLMFFFLESVK